jgi:hypothetical protein
MDTYILQLQRTLLERYHLIPGAKEKIVLSILDEINSEARNRS